MLQAYEGGQSQSFEFLSLFGCDFILKFADKNTKQIMWGGEEV